MNELSVVLAMSLVFHCGMYYIGFLADARKAERYILELVED